jgi:stage II sporulation protein D
VSSHRARSLLGVVALAVAILAAVPAAPASGPARAATTGGVSVDVTGSTVRFEGAPSVIINAEDGQFVDTIEVRRAPGGDVIVVNELNMQDYVAGIAEMPTRWPLEALKAQAVAARTYAWFELKQGRWQRFGYDVCATTSCQVFRGTKVVNGSSTGKNWQQAVDETEGEVLVFEGEPILARYFSTSGGRTWDNDVVFPSEGAFPYLIGTEDPDDATSPLHKWQVRFTREQFDTMLARGGTLADVAPLASITIIPSDVPGRVKTVRATGENADVIEVGPIDFASFVSAVAPELWPDDYPPKRLSGAGVLPSTMPSSRFAVAMTEDEVIIDGTGWGHGVGMGQYGALGKAERGLGHDEILGTYYGGLSPVRAPELPERIRVGLSATQGAVPVRLDGPARLVIGDQVITERALGAWTVQDGPGQAISVIAPEGFGEPLRIEATTTTRVTPNEVEIIELRTAVNKTVEVRLDVFSIDGQLISSSPQGVHARGVVLIPWSLDDITRRALPPGSYDVMLVATDEDAVQNGTPITVSVRPFIAGTGSTEMPANIWSATTDSGSSIRLDPRQLALAMLLGLALGRGFGLAAARLGRSGAETPIAEVMM